MSGERRRLLHYARPQNLRHRVADSEVDVLDEAEVVVAGHVSMDVSQVIEFSAGEPRESDGRAVTIILQSY